MSLIKSEFVFFSLTARFFNFYVSYSHTFHDHASALVNSLLDADFVKIWEENYRQDLVDGLKRIKACRKDRNESESFAR